MRTRIERFTIERLSEPADFEALLRRDVREGLTATPKTLPSIYFYDDHGSDLFDQITELPEYYLTRLEAEILEEHADKLISRYCPHELTSILLKPCARQVWMSWNWGFPFPTPRRTGLSSNGRRPGPYRTG